MDNIYTRDVGINGGRYSCKASVIVVITEVCVCVCSQTSWVPKIFNLMEICFKIFSKKVLKVAMVFRKLLAHFCNVLLQTHKTPSICPRILFVLHTTVGGNCVISLRNVNGLIFLMERYCVHIVRRTHELGVFEMNSTLQSTFRYPAETPYEKLKAFFVGYSSRPLQRVTQVFLKKHRSPLKFYAPKLWYEESSVRKTRKY